MAVGSWLLAPVLLAVIIRPALCQWPTNIPGEGGGRIPPTVGRLCYDAHADCRAPASKAGNLLAEYSAHRGQGNRALFLR